MARYKKNNSTAIIRDSIAIARKLSWKKAIVSGAIGFIVLYFIVPWMLPVPVAETAIYQPLMDKIANRGQWIFEKLGIAVLVVFWFFALLNYWKGNR